MKIAMTTFEAETLLKTLLNRTNEMGSIQEVTVTDPNPRPTEEMIQDITLKILGPNFKNRIEAIKFVRQYSLDRASLTEAKQFVEALIPPSDGGSVPF